MDETTSPKRKRLSENTTSERLTKKAHCNDGEIPIHSSSKLVNQAVSPLRIKDDLGPFARLGGSAWRPDEAAGETSTKYCYRHQPDLKCRPKADEPSLDQLQHALELLSPNDQQGIAHVWALFSAAPAKHRNLMLQGILSQCCFPQLSYLSARLGDLVRIDFLSTLPTELAFKILCYLDTTSLCKATQVSGRWRQLADDDVIWHRMCEQHIDRKCTTCGWGLPLLERKRLRATKREIHLRASGYGLNESSADARPGLETISRRASVDSERSTEQGPSSTSSSRLHDQTKRRKFRPWKEVYKDRFEIGSNWKHGRYSTRIFRGHTNGVMCLQFDEKYLITGSYDATLKVWDLDTGALVRTLQGHHSGIRSLQFDSTKLISGSLDNTIKVWNWHNGECLRTISGHAGGVLGVHFASTYLISGSADSTVRVWDFEDKSTSVLRGHTDWVNAVRLDLASRTIFSASDDLTVRLWDLDSKSTLRIFEGHVGQVQQVIPMPPEFEISDPLVDPQASDASASPASDLSPPPASGVLTSSPSTPSLGLGLGHDTDHDPDPKAARPSPPRYMLTSALDSTIRLWDVSTGHSIRTFFGHVEGVWALAADTLRVVSGSEDHSVKLWDPRSGDCEATFLGHTAPVTCVSLSDFRMATGGEDGEVRLYSFDGWTREGSEKFEHEI